MKILVTGCAGFIGMHTTLKLLQRGDEVVGIDNLNAYYALTLKEARLQQLAAQPNFIFQKLDIKNQEQLLALFTDWRPEVVINLAAQAGVSYSVTNPEAYFKDNMLGFFNILEACRLYGVKHLVFASSSSVYGSNTILPFKEQHNVDRPLSFYAASKKSNELMAHSYSHVYNLAVTGLRFFTVYGPWGRPDMALFKFTEAILAGKPIVVYNHGLLERDFTYIDDIVAGIVKVCDKTPTKALKEAPYRIFNIGNGTPVTVLALITALEQALDKTALKVFADKPLAELDFTAADTSELFNWVGFKPSTLLQAGVQNFVLWYKKYNGAEN